MAPKGQAEMQKTVPRMKSRKAMVSLLCLFAAANAVRLFGQRPAEVPLNDNSDWWSFDGALDNPKDGGLIAQKRTIADANFRILGMDIRKGALSQSGLKLGEATVMDRGDAGTSRGQKCYLSSNPKDMTDLVVEEGEVNNAFYLFSENASWNGKEYCSRSPRISRYVATASGLELGLTPAGVIKILGKPGFRSQTELQYLVESRKETSPEELSRFRKGNPDMSEKEFQENYRYYDITVFIRLKFVRSKLTYLAISESETY
ncbi:MAG: hypothetical protein ABSC76_03740 [Terracidiphilus sp.]|jgi:hypothetical protein